MREKVKQLWRCCFNDSEEFTDLYFSLRYRDEFNVSLCDDHRLIAALQLLPYSMTFAGTEIPVDYVSGACTHPNYRNRGVMRLLLLHAFYRMYDQGIPLSALIPAESWLFDYYARSGYVSSFCCRKQLFTACTPVSSSVSTFPPDFTVVCTRDYDPEVYAYLDRKLHERPCCMLHTEQDFHIVMADLKLSGGTLFTLRRSDTVVALAVAYPDGSSWYIAELLADAPQLQQLLLQYICHTLDLSAVRLVLPPSNDDAGQPLGMIRVIHAENLLRMYAATHPQLTWQFFLTDPFLPENNGYYYLCDGNCTKSAEQPPVDYPTLTIDRLAGKLLANLPPYMSLMLNE